MGLCEVVLTRIDRVEDPTRVGERCKSESRYVFSFRCFQFQESITKAGGQGASMADREMKLRQAWPGKP